MLGASPNSSESDVAFPVAARWEVVVECEVVEHKVDDIAPFPASIEDKESIGHMVEPLSSKDVPLSAQGPEHRDE